MTRIAGTSASSAIAARDLVSHLTDLLPVEHAFEERLFSKHFERRRGKIPYP